MHWFQDLLFNWGKKDIDDEKFWRPACGTHKEAPVKNRRSAGAPWRGSESPSSGILISRGANERHRPASDKGYTDANSALMARLKEQFHGAGFEILAFPSNWFGQNETESSEEIKALVQEKCRSGIILMDKSDYEESPVFALGKKTFPGKIATFMESFCSESTANRLTGLTFSPSTSM